MGLKIGTFKEKLKIEEGSKLAGYPNTETRFCKGSKGDIEANGIILKNDKNFGCLVSLDILGIELPFTEKIREKVEKEFKIPFDNIMICCTHTHSSVITVGRKFGADKEFLNEIERKILKGIEDGFKNIEEVNLKWTKTEVDISHNRRVVIDGKAKNEWQDIEKKHTGIVDEEVICIGFFKKNGDLKSLIVNYACHPVVLGPSNYYASADFVGYLRSFLENNLNLENLVYITGASGNINPRICITDNFEVAKKTGETIGEQILKCKENFHNLEVNDFHFDRKKVVFIKKDGTGILETEMQILKIGEKIIFITLPGEPVVEIGLDIKKKSKYPVTIVAGYTNDYIGYISTDKILSEGGHEANSCPVKEVEKTIKEIVKNYMKNGRT
ncbi:MAG TPA: neutral/alkaline non-lysosomal ceramidase N-terminal domain-containing protein [bacterium]|nr:neutral/alkaline non-lysosomal ceramidase N-terminal domain-containing protein [bacterium]HOM26366.1 neutral/alkaline non-lysosomal ceramidase N-terminal domain-containing protein [bacterium]